MTNQLLTEAVIAAELQRLIATGPREWNVDQPPPVSIALDIRGAAIRVLIQRGLAEVDADLGVLRAKQAPKPVDPPPDLPYAVTPALEALRARRRELGR